MHGINVKHTIPPTYSVVSRNKSESSWLGKFHQKVACKLNICTKSPYTASVRSAVELMRGMWNQPSSFLATASSRALNALIWFSGPPWEPNPTELTSSPTVRRRNSRPAVGASREEDGLSSCSPVLWVKLRSIASSRLWRELLIVVRAYCEARLLVFL